MVEDKAEPRETNWRQLLPWIDLFQGFRVAMDLNKLLLAAAGILVMAFGWWLMASLFHYQKPTWSNYQGLAVADVAADTPEKREAVNWAIYRDVRDRWNLNHETAGSADDGELIEPADL